MAERSGVPQETELQPMSASQWDAAYGRGVWPWDEEPPAEMFQLLAAHWPPPALLVDVGCGVGTTARAAAALGYSVFGFDQSAVAIELARERTPADSACSFEVLDLVRDGARIPQPDVLVDRGVLHTVPNPMARARFVQALASVCEPGRLWLHIGAAADEAEGSTSFVYGPSALTGSDFRSLVQPWFAIVELRAISYGQVPDETDLPARLALLRRTGEPAGTA